MSCARAAAVWCAMALLGAPLAGAAAYRPWLPFGYQGSLPTCYEDRCDVYGRALVLPGDRRLLIGAGPDVRGVLPGSGATDPTFRAPRVVTAADGVRAWIPQLATTPDGEVLVGVDALEGRGSIRRLGLDGELQLGFAGPAGAFAGLGSLPDGRFVAFRSGDARQGEVWRFLRDGQPDPGFGTGGRSTAAVSRAIQVRALAADPFGRLLVAGSMLRSALTGVVGRPAVVLRLGADGLVDASFGEGGVAVVPLGDFGGEAIEVLVEPDGGYLYFDTEALVQRSSRNRAVTPGRLQYLGAGGSRDALRPAFERRGGDWGRVTLGYSTADVTAIAGRDYAATSGELVWEDGDSQGRSFQIPVLGSACSPAGGTPLELSIRFGEPAGGATFAAVGAVRWTPACCCSGARCSRGGS